MGTRVQIFTDSETEAKAWLVVFRCLGLQIVGRPSNSITRDGTWMVRARSNESEQAPQRAS